ncbi:hypothetical protein AN958_11460 [Leucoagaricus sp. SymC.cos]|nr:hypothetical protein AN958_11460 [Leucoagaricus sp. SymC.cos]
MDDIDDYFDDDLVLDEQTLAILDREEKRHLTQKQQQTPPPSAVTKKQKTGDGWSPGVGGRLREQDYDDLPEISVTVDGNYGFMDSTSVPSIPSQPPPRPPIQPSALPPRRQNHLNPRLLSRPQPVPASPWLPVTNVQTRANPASNVQPRASPVPSNRDRNANQIPPVSDGTLNQTEFDKQTADLKAQLSELKNENQKIQAALKEATDIRYAKEGEVSILRKSIEKITQNHAAEIAKMKTAKEETDNKHKQMERQMKEEAERLKTQFMFKAMPNQINLWKASQDTDHGQNGVDTPQKQPSAKPSPHAARVARRSPEVTKKLAFLPGFQNSFTTTPSKLGTKVDHKGKGKEVKRDDSIEDVPQALSQRPVAPVATPMHQRSVDSFDFGDSIDVVPSSDDMMAQVDEDGDSAMLMENPEVMNDIEPIEHLNHKAEFRSDSSRQLSRIILMHTHMEANETTFQLLIALPFIAHLPSAQTQICTRASQSILLALSHPVDDSDYEICSQQVAKYLIVILRCLNEALPCTPAMALLDLLGSLALSLPAFTKTLLSEGSENEEDSFLLVTLFDLLDHVITLSQTTVSALIREILSLLEVIVSNIPDEMVARLSMIPKRISSLLALLNASQTHEVLESLSRLLLLLTTHNTIHAPLLNIAGDREISGHKDSSLIYYVCTYILESFSSNSTQAKLLVQSTVVIPTLIYLVAQLAITVWNDDECTLTTPQSHLMIRLINQSLFLLHHLVHSFEPMIRLHDKLQRAPHRNLSNLVHMFVVSFGQLSYADPPGWLDSEGKSELECLVDTARGLLDLVVDGPEGDSVWAAYQMEPDGNQSETDDEEREARLMDSDMQP